MTSHAKIAFRGPWPKLRTSFASSGNLGAHDAEAADVPVIADLAEALLEYLYRAPAQLAAVQAGLAQRKKSASKAKKMAARKTTPNE
jgi:hypothetical protein